MTIKYRKDNIKSLTHEELDENFRDLRYDTNLDRVSENGNTTNINIRVDSIKANNIIASSVIVENISNLSANTLSYTSVNPVTNENLIELPSGTKITGVINANAASPIMSRGNLINVAHRHITIVDSISPATSIPPSTSIYNTSNYRHLYLMAYRPLTRGFTGPMYFQNHLKIEVSLSCSMNTSLATTIGLTLWSKTNDAGTEEIHGTHYFPITSFTNASMTTSHFNLCATWNIYNKVSYVSDQVGRIFRIHFETDGPSRIWVNSVPGGFNDNRWYAPYNQPDYYDKVRGTSSFTIYEYVL